MQSNAAWPEEGNEALTSYISIGVLGKDNDEYSAQEIMQLERHGWICIRNNAAGTSHIYVAPKMTAQRNQQKSHRKLRSALKKVMSMIDCSVDAWEGRRPPAHGSKISNGHETQDESLWYIFNTLENPCPDPTVMRDPWSRRAMDDLLSDEDFSHLGLKTRLYPYQRHSAATMVQRESQPAQMLDPRLQPWKSPSGLVYYYDQEEGVVTREKAMYSEACGGKFTYPNIPYKERLTWHRYSCRDYGMRQNTHLPSRDLGYSGTRPQNPGQVFVFARQAQFNPSPKNYWLFDEHGSGSNRSTLRALEIFFS